MNVDRSMGEKSSRDEIAREVASAIADDVTCLQEKDKSSTSLNFDASQTVNFVSSDSGSFVRISTSSEDMIAPAVESVVPSTADVTLNLDEDGSSRLDSDGSTVGGGGGKGVWSWISSAVGGDIVETTQRLGRNLVQKTKVEYVAK